MWKQLSSSGDGVGDGSGCWNQHILTSKYLQTTQFCGGDDNGGGWDGDGGASGSISSGGVVACQGGDVDITSATTCLNYLILCFL